jgi:predicted transcriptional regulator of viral defense system
LRFITYIVILRRNKQIKQLDVFKNIEEFIHYKRTLGAYSFSTDELKKHLKTSNGSINQSLWRYKSKGKICTIRKGFHVIITPEYSRSGIIPLQLFIDDMMKWLKRDYYISLYSAAALYGAAHQQPQEYSVMTESPQLRKIVSNKIVINFSQKEKWSGNDIEKMKTDAGFINVSTQELTAFDLLNYLKHSGLERSVNIISELCDKLDKAKLLKTASRYISVSAIQRLGYLLEYELSRNDLSEPLHKLIRKKKLHYIPLSPGKQKKGEFITKWKIIKNIDINLDT